MYDRIACIHSLHLCEMKYIDNIKYGEVCFLKINKYTHCKIASSTANK
jgi:hypothetical protein